jgi:hypothetical protein
MSKAPLTITLVLLVVFVFGFRWFRPHVASGSPAYLPVHQCQANLKQIDGAKATWAEEHHKTTNDTPAWSELVGKDHYLVSQPVCSKGGTYSLGRVGERARCTVAGHEL